jgi:imidazolonepropionase-like amidohydrolase
VHVIQADLLIPGRGEPLSDAAIVYNTKTILYVGPQADSPECYNSLDATHVPVVMPGLWDCHVDFLGLAGGTSDLWKLNPIVSGARSVRDLELLLNAGYTSVRECGGNGIFLDQVVEDGYCIGPKIYSCGLIISCTGGHADDHDIPLSTWHDSCSQGLQVWLCDGVDECTKAVRLQTRKGAKFIKICASGGVLSQKDDPKHQQYSAQELQAFVYEAALSERIVAAHCHGKAGIMAALRAGARTIEHGTYLDLECVALMKEKEAILVPTRTLHEVLRTGLSATSATKMIDASKNLKLACQLAIQHGVNIALGPTLGLSIIGHPAAHGQNALELGLAVDAGMSPLASIEEATASGPLTLGPQAPLSGQIAVGYDPDFIAVSSSPLEDISVLVNPDNITHVWRRGTLYKSPDCTKI